MEREALSEQLEQRGFNANARTRSTSSGQAPARAPGLHKGKGSAVVGTTFNHTPGCAPSLSRLAFTRSFREAVADLGVKLNMKLLFAIMLFFMARECVRAQVTTDMERQFEKQLRKSLKEASIDDFFLCCAWENLSSDDIDRMKNNRREIFDGIRALGPDISFVFHNPSSSPYLKKDLREHLQGKSWWVPTPPAEMMVEIAATVSRKKERPTSILLPLGISDGKLKHIAWKKE